MSQTRKLYKDLWLNKIFPKLAKHDLYALSLVSRECRQAAYHELFKRYHDDKISGLQASIRDLNQRMPSYFYTLIGVYNTYGRERFEEPLRLIHTVNLAALMFLVPCAIDLYQYGYPTAEAIEKAKVILENTVCYSELCQIPIELQLAKFPNDNFFTLGISIAANLVFPFISHRVLNYWYRDNIERMETHKAERDVLQKKLDGLLSLKNKLVEKPLSSLSFFAPALAKESAPSYQRCYTIL